MKENFDKLEKEVDNVQKEAEGVYTFAMHALDTKNEENAKARKCFLTIIIALIVVILAETMGFVYYISNYGVLEEETTEQEGIYNFIDSKGNTVSSDLSLEDMKELIELNGKD